MILFIAKRRTGGMYFNWCKLQRENVSNNSKFWICY